MRILKLGGGAAVLAALLFAALVFSSSDAHTAQAATNSSISCVFSNAVGDGSAASVTCTFTFFGKPHTLVVSFTDNNPAGPSRNDRISGCTLDTRPLRICGPLPAS